MQQGGIRNGFINCKSKYSFRVCLTRIAHSKSQSLSLSLSLSLNVRTRDTRSLSLPQDRDWIINVIIAAEDDTCVPRQ